MTTRTTEPTLGLEWRVFGFTLWATDYGLGYHAYLLWDGERVATITAGAGTPSVIFRDDEAEDLWRQVAGRAYSAQERETVERLLHDAGLWPTSDDWQPTTERRSDSSMRAVTPSTRASARRIVRVARLLA